jgi:hypothetical protein
MRLWSIHPEYLDSKGLVALWRETLLAQKVLLGNTKGYTKHPQLIRFNNTSNPIGAIACYLRTISDEADRRGYNFNRNKIADKKINSRIPVTKGQVDYEFKHLLEKIRERDPDLYKHLEMIDKVKLNPLFKEICGTVEEWERI